MTCRVFGRTHWFPTKFSSSKYEINRVATIVINGTLVISTVLLNLIAMLTILKSTQLKNKICYFLILIQSVVDLGVGCIGAPLSVFYMLGTFLGLRDCFTSFIIFQLSVFPIGFSLVISFIILFERYIAVLHPYSYPKILTKKRILYFMICGFALIFISFALSFYFIAPIAVMLFLTVPTLIIFAGFVNIKIYLEVRRLRRSEVKPSLNNIVEHKSKTKLFLREVKYAKSCFLVVACFLITLLPSSLYPIFRLRFGPSMIVDAYFSWMRVITTLNSSVNSVIFFWNKVLLRKEAVKVLKVGCCRSFSVTRSETTEY
ncbi:prostaglandin E2 receptor EP2 subtype-like [Dendronephthya gigantea]|uniref:prostaglandin E2 receptor EP2 subtype-like n=1 Tax=Dendronephthya gigantea TaxID=151771 RepID=UPI00106BE9AB|nr:prostaglandin E2 receptor EP2 subtype-like [Dendronephthya gigantea]